MNKNVTDAASALPRQLGLFDAASTMVGIILGAGIFVAPATIARVAGTPGWACAYWFVGSLVAACGALCYAECGARLPRDGGFFIFYEAVFGPSVAAMAGWAALLITYPASLAGVALIGGQYMGEAFPAFASSSHLVALVLLTLAAAVNCLGVQLGLWLQRALSSTKVIALITVCAAALLRQTPQPSIQTLPAAGVDSYLAAFAVLMWTYDGWTDITLISGELRDPARNLGRTVTLGLATICVVYSIAQLAVLRLLPVATAANSQQVLADATAVALGPVGSRAMGWLVIVSTASSVQGLLFVTSRLAYAMAQSGAVPRYLAAVHPTLKTPVNALVAVWLITLLYLATNSFNQLVSFFSFAIWVFYGLTAVTLLILRQRGTGEPLAWRAPGKNLPPAVFLTAAGVMTILQVVENPRRVAIGAGLIAGAAVLHHLSRRLRLK